MEVFVYFSYQRVNIEKHFDLGSRILISGTSTEDMLN